MRRNRIRAPDRAALLHSSQFTHQRRSRLGQARGRASICFTSTPTIVMPPTSTMDASRCFAFPRQAAQSPRSPSLKHSEPQRHRRHRWLNGHHHRRPHRALHRRHPPPPTSLQPPGLRATKSPPESGYASGDSPGNPDALHHSLSHARAPKSPPHLGGENGLGNCPVPPSLFPCIKPAFSNRG